MFGPPRIRLQKPFHKIATDADLGRPDRRLALTQPQEIAVCAYCREPIQRVGEDALNWCEGCQQLEGDVKYVTEGEE